MIMVLMKMMMMMMSLITFCCKNVRNCHMIYKNFYQTVTILLICRKWLRSSTTPRFIRSFTVQYKVVQMMFCLTWRENTLLRIFIILLTSYEKGNEDIQAINLGFPFGSTGSFCLVKYVVLWMLLSSQIYWDWSLKFWNLYIVSAVNRPPLLQRLFTQLKPQENSNYLSCRYVYTLTERKNSRGIANWAIYIRSRGGLLCVWFVTVPISLTSVLYLHRKGLMTSSPVYHQVL